MCDDMVQIEIPKTIWMLWLQGIDNAPDVVQKCYLSWQRHNPDWVINMLDEDTMRQFVDIEMIIKKNRNGINNQHIADILRINLLNKYGGVWVDSTCFCCQPLDNWINDYALAGFFAFYGPGRDRLFDNWFLASAKGNYLVQKQCEQVNRFFRENEFNYDNKKRFDRKLESIVEKHRILTGLSFSFLINKILKIYPYFWFHYLFNQIIRKDKECRRIWEEAKKVSAQEPLKLQLAGLLRPVTAEIKKELDLNKQFLHKLTWKYDKSKFSEECVLAYVLGLE